MFDQRELISSLTLVTAPTTEPVAVADLKAQLRLEATETHDDAFLGGLIKAARELVETDTRRALVPQTWQLVLPRFPRAIQFRLAPVRSLAIAYYDRAGQAQTLPASQYCATLFAEPVVVRPVSGLSWPDTYDRLDAITVTCGVGYADPAQVPERAKLAIRLLAAHWYECREAAGTRPAGEHALAYERLIQSLMWG
jgi:uncharacterized phiE125 gp8 family phage protein